MDGLCSEWHWEPSLEAGMLPAPCSVLWVPEALQRDVRSSSGGAPPNSDRGVEDAYMSSCFITRFTGTWIIQFFG